MELYADIVLPLAQPHFTYRVGGELRECVVPGMCVEVNIGPRKIMTGIVWRLHTERPPYKTVKTVERLVPHSPVIRDWQRRFWEWMASYYMCSIGEVMRAALPSALKPGGLSAEEFSQAGYRPRTVELVSLAPGVGTEDKLDETFEKLRRAPRQYEALIKIVEAAGGGKEPPAGFEADPAKLGIDRPALKNLEKRGVVAITKKEVAADGFPPLDCTLPELTEHQARALGEIESLFGRKETVLLHGVTGSGKTEIYITLIARALARGQDVLYLLPEIALTAQLIKRMKHYFGERVITYHSRFTERQRTESYLRAASGGGGKLVMGVRSAIFLPATDLGLVIVDEEHESSFKQADPAPRYNARDCAVVLASMAGAKTLLGSATPSIESYTNASEGKYGLVALDRRYGDSPLPQVIISDTLVAAKRGERFVHFNKILTDKIASALSAGQQVMLFQNRRGFAPYVECPGCGWTAVCPNCNVTATLHKAEGKLICHYCGAQSVPSAVCPACSKNRPEARGFGTEKIEEELSKLFPEARLARLDRDTARSPRAYDGIIAAFERGDTDILVGTQMITKGFDFAGVSLVGILNADNLLNYPDFRAAERAYQMMTQVAGRAGRRAVQGEVVIQTSQPDSLTIRQVASGDYAAMVRTQMAERQQFFYPPYSRIINITLRHRDKALLWRAAGEFGRRAREVFGARLFGPEPPPVDKIKGEHIVSFMLKIERNASSFRAKDLLRDVAAGIAAMQEFKYVAVVWNVDPV